MCFTFVKMGFPKVLFARGGNGRRRETPGFSALRATENWIRAKRAANARKGFRNMLAGGCSILQRNLNLLFDKK